VAPVRRRGAAGRHRETGHLSVYLFVVTITSLRSPSGLC